MRAIDKIWFTLGRVCGPARILLQIIFFVCLLRAPVRADEGKDKIYLMGVEQFDPADASSITKLYPNTTVLDPAELKIGKADKRRKRVVSETTVAQSSDSLRKTLQSFQDAIKDLCISQVELSLAFSASAHAWVVVNGDVSASAKVIIKNTNEKCK